MIKDIFATILGALALKISPAFTANSLLRDQLKIRGIDPGQVELAYPFLLAPIAAEAVLKARRPDGSIDPTALCGFLQEGAIRVHAMLSDSPAQPQSAQAAPDFAEAGGCREEAKMTQMTQEEFDSLTHEQRKNIHLAKVYIELSGVAFARAEECPPDSYSGVIAHPKIPACV
jgi:hypothetical protein